MKNKKGNAWIGFLIFALLVIGVIILVSAMIPNSNPPVKPSPPDTNITYPQYTISNPNNCLNKKDTWNWGKVTCSITIKNLEPKIPIQLEPTFRCWRLNSPNSPENIKATKKAIASGESAEFTIKFDNKDREWTCIIGDANPTPI